MKAFNKARWFTIALTSGVLFSGTLAQAAITENPVGYVTRIYTYTDYGTGDVVFEVQNPPAACANGFWVRMSDVGAKSTYAYIMLAYSMQTPLRIGAYDTDIWPGSGGKYCRLYFAGTP